MRLTIAFTWAWAALVKVTDWETFQTTVRSHAVLAERFQPFLLIVPILELLLTISVLAVVRPRWAAVAVLGASLAALLALLVYLSQVPAEALARAGCGCLGGSRGGTRDYEVSPFYWHIALGIAHVVGLSLLRPELSSMPGRPMAG